MYNLSLPCSLSVCVSLYTSVHKMCTHTTRNNPFAQVCMDACMYVCTSPPLSSARSLVLSLSLSWTRITLCYPLHPPSSHFGVRRWITTIGWVIQMRPTISQSAASSHYCELKYEILHRLWCWCLVNKFYSVFVCVCMCASIYTKTYWFFPSSCTSEVGKSIALKFIDYFYGVFF